MSDPEHDRFFITKRSYGHTGWIRGFLYLRKEDGSPLSGVRVTISPQTIPNRDMDKLFHGACTVELVTDERGKVEYTFLRDAVIDVYIKQLDLFRTIVVPDIGEEFDILKARTVQEY